MLIDILNSRCYRYQTLANGYEVLIHLANMNHVAHIYLSLINPTPKMKDVKDKKKDTIRTALVPLHFYVVPTTSLIGV